MTVTYWLTTACMNSSMNFSYSTPLTRFWRSPVYNGSSSNSCNTMAQQSRCKMKQNSILQIITANFCTNIQTVYQQTVTMTAASGSVPDCWFQHPVWPADSNRVQHQHMQCTKPACQLVCPCHMYLSHQVPVFALHLSLQSPTAAYTATVYYER